MVNKQNFLKILLVGGGIYYSIGAVLHLFGLTLFPFYVGELYAPYHDVLIFLTTITLAMVLFAIAKDPVKNLNVLDVMIAGGILAIVFSVVILYRIDFTALGAPAKKTQTIVEMVMLIIYVSLLFYLKPKK